MKKVQFFLLITASLFSLQIPAQYYKIELVKDIYPGPIGSYPNWLVAGGANLYFTANNGTNGYELWKSNGTEAGTQMVLDLNNVGANNSNPQYLTAINGNLYFGASDGTNGNELWRHQYAGAGAGLTTMIKDINPGANSSAPTVLTDLNGTLLFWANNGTNGTELWKSTGTAASTQMIEDISLGAISTPIANLFNVNSNIFFKGGGFVNAGLLLATENSVSNPISVRGFNEEYFNPSDYGKLNGTLFISATGNTSGGNSVGRELFVKESDDFAVDLLKDINVGTGDSSPDNFINSNGQLFFTAYNGTQTSLWKTDGTVAGTVLVKSIMPSTSFFNFCNVNGVLFFCTANTNGLQLWKSNGTTLGTTLVKQINNSTVISNYEAINVNGTLLFTISDGTHGVELWQSNGTPDGTFMVTDLNPAGSSFPENLTKVDDVLFFTANNGTSGIELYKMYNCYGSTLNYSIKNGNWHDPTVWSCGRVPATTEQVTIKGHIININTNAGVNKIIFEGGGNITIPAGSTLTYYINPT